MSDYKQIRNVLKVIDVSLIHGRDPLLAYLVGMAREHCENCLKAENRQKADTDDYGSMAANGPPYR